MNGELERVFARDSRRVGKRYERVGVLGRGATGTVYRANDRLHRRLVALKSALVDREPSGDDPLASQPIRTSGSLAREFLLLSGLRHPNIVTCMEYGKGVSDDAYLRWTFTTTRGPSVKPRVICPTRRRSICSCRFSTRSRTSTGAGSCIAT
jgi:serine/threonine protein kinase